MNCVWKCCTLRNSHLNSYWKKNYRFAYFGQIQLYFQKQPFADNLHNRCLIKNFAIFTGKHLCCSLLSITLQAFSPATSLKRLQHRCFPVNITNFLGTASFMKHLWWLLLYSEQLQPYILTVFWGIWALWTISILLPFFSDRVRGCPMEGASYCCFCKAVSNNFFQQVLLINIISTYANLLQHFIFARFLLIEDYGKCALRKEPVIGCSFKHIFFEGLTDKFH